MKHSLRFLTAVLGLGLSASVAVAQSTVPVVTGVSATPLPNGVEVTWKPVELENLHHYRIYFGRASILKNTGQYDDFVNTQDTSTSYLLTELPEATELYVAVLAVDDHANTSNIFVEEAKVLLSGTVTTKPTNSGSTVTKPTQLELISAEAVSSTGVLLRFNAAPFVDKKDAVNAFDVRSSSGLPVALRRLTLQSTTALLTTAEPQLPGMSYTITVNAVVKGKGAPDLALNMAKAVTSVWGFGTTPDMMGTQTGSTVTPPPVTTGSGVVGFVIKDVTNLKLRAQEQPNGRYLVIAEWKTENTVQELAGYRVMQSTDGGATYGPAQNVPADSTGIRFPDVTPGNFSIAVVAGGLNSTFSKAVTASINLPATKGYTPGKVPSKIPLATTGAATVFVFVGAGALMGWKKMRKQTIIQGA